MNKEIRLRKNREFQTVYRRGKNFWNRNFTIFIRPTNRKKVKFGVSVTKKFGKANKRNLIKRRIKEISVFKKEDSYFLRRKTRK